MKFSSRLLILILFFSCKSLYAQRLTHVQGEILVQLSETTFPQSLINKYALHRGQSTGIFIREKVSNPMNIYAFKFDFATINEKELLDRIRADRGVLNAQFNHIISLRSTTPNDSQYNQQWQYNNTGQSGGTAGADIDIDLAWDTTTGGMTPDGDEIVVCIIDDGIDLNHTDMIPNIWVNSAEIANNGIDDDNNGFIDDRLGWNTGTNNDNVGTGGVHGTPVAGIVGAKGNNTTGVAGVNWDVKLMIVTGGTGVESEVLEAYSYPLSFRKRYNETNGQEGAFVVATNASWGVDLGQAADAPLWCAFYDTLGVHGILNAGATINGNNNVDIDGDLPTTCPSDHLIAVTNMNHNDQKVTQAGYGATSIDLGAFGEGTHTVTSGNGYGGFGGTSGATPHVAGTIALLYSAPCPDLIGIAKSNPAAASLLVREYILQGVDQNASLQGITVTGGRLNVNNSMQLLMDNCGACIEPIASQPTNVTQTSAELDWFVNSSTNTVNLRWREVGTPTWNTVMQITNPYSLTGLVGCTEYEYQLQSVCTMETTPFSESYMFKTDGCCENPSSLNITLDSETAATINWSPITVATSYTLRYRILNSATWSMLNTTSTTLQITDLMPCLDYEVQIQVDCNGVQPGFSESTDFKSIGCGNCIDLAYCAAPNIDASEEWIDNVMVHTLNNNSGSDNGYGDYTNLSVTFMAGQTYPITIAPGYSGQSYGENFRVWIDYNQDGAFTGSDELVFDSGGLVTVPVSGNVAVPATALGGSTRMRVFMQYDSAAPTACTAATDFGEIEDYCVDIMTNNNNCPPELVINDIPITNNTYHAANKVTSAGLVNNTGVVNFKAGIEIDLLAEFNVEQGAVFEATIENCN